MELEENIFESNDLNNIFISPILKEYLDGKPDFEESALKYLAIIKVQKYSSSLKIIKINHSLYLRHLLCCKH